MTDYTKLVEALRFCTRWHMADDALANAEQAADAIEALQAEVLKRGEWEPFDLTWGRSIYSCTVCGEAADVPTENGKALYKYCPNCGADMRTKMEVQDGQ